MLLNEKMFAHHTSDKGLISKRYKVLAVQKEIKNPLGKNVKRYRQDSEEDICLTNKHMITSVTCHAYNTKFPHVIRGSQMKTTVRYDLIL